MSSELSLTNKTAELSKRYTGSLMRSEDGEGEEGGDAGSFEPGRKYRYSKIKVGERFVAAISKHPGLWQMLFNFGPNNRPLEPASEVIGPIAIKGKFTSPKASLAWGISNKIELINARITNVKLQAVGTECHLSFHMQAVFPETIDSVKLEKHGGQQLKITCRFAEIEEGDDDEDADQVDFVDEQNDQEGSEDASQPTRPGPGMPAGARH
ncbi:MAG TPA: hypothetical protein VD932_04010 [Aquabacterium sp.]|nr:hypothetical protein [Aquabacterium sp.]